MARIHGRNGRIYVALTSGGTAEPLAFMDTWTIDFTVDKAEVTAFGDANKVYVSGIPDVKGTFSGYYDDSTVQTYTAATDGVARKFYLYPSNTNNGQYWFGTVLPDFSVTGGIGDAVKVSGSWSAASAIPKVG
jgi:hypothetical protein